MSFPYFNRPHCTPKADQGQAGRLKGSIRGLGRAYSVNVST